MWRKKAEALIRCGDCYGEAISAEQLALYERLFAEVDDAAFAAALDRHMLDPERGRFFPRPADVQAKLAEAGPRHLPPDAAWAIVLTSLDEAETVVWTPEMAEARNLALPIWEAGDRVGARMAFKAAYERLLAGAGRPVWQVSLGHDADKRRVALERAQAMGLLSAQEAARYLPAPVTPEGAGAAIAGLLTGYVVELPLDADARTRRRLAELRAAIDSAGAARQAGRAEVAARGRADFAARKAAALAWLTARQDEQAQAPEQAARQG